jgi:uncharacterized protein (TIGR03067 family)
MTPLLLTIPLIAAAPIPKEFRKELPQLDGSWQQTGIEFNGRQIGGNQTAVWKFEGDSLTIEYPGRGINAVPRPIKTDAKASPKEFQFGNGSTQLGVYEIKDDTLTISLSQQAGVRPADTAGGPNVIRYLFTRVKDK